MVYNRLNQPRRFLTPRQGNWLWFFCLVYFLLRIVDGNLTHPLWFMLIQYRLSPFYPSPPSSRFHPTYTAFGHSSPRVLSLDWCKCWKFGFLFSHRGGNHVIFCAGRCGKSNPPITPFYGWRYNTLIYTTSCAGIGISYPWQIIGCFIG